MGSGEKGAAKWARRNESGEMGSGEKGAAERARRNESGESSINHLNELKVIIVTFAMSLQAICKRYK